MAEPGNNGKADKRTKKDLAAEVEELRRRALELEEAGLDAEALRASREDGRRLLAALMDTIPDYIYFKDSQSRFTLLNKALAGRFGLSDPTQAGGRTDFDFFTEYHARMAFEDEQQVMRTGQPIVGKEEKETWPDGTVTWASTTKVPLRNRHGEIIGTFGISRDITARKRVEGKLEESEARFRALLQMAPDIIYRIDGSGRVQFISQAVSFLGYTPDELLGRSLSELVHPEDAERMKWALRERRIGPRATRELEVRLRRKVAGSEQERNPAYMFVAITARGLWDVPDERVHEPHKMFLGTEGVIRDITRRKRAEEELARHRENLEELVAERTRELRESYEKLRAEVAERQRIEQALRAERDRAQNYLDIAGTMLVVLDPQGHLTLINRKGLEILGYEEEQEILGKDWFSACVPPSEARDARETWERLMSGKVEESESRVQTRDGQVRIIAWHNSVLTGEGGRATGTLSSGEDITQRRRAEEALLQSERLEAISAMAQGVAFNFSNVIGLISGCASSIAANSIPGTSAHEEALRALEATRHASDLTKRLMSVARASTAAESAQLQRVSLAKVIGDAVSLVREGFQEKGVQLRVSEAQKMPHVRADPSQLFDALMVFLVNAQQAMPGGGTIGVEVARKRITRPPLDLNARAEGGPYAVIRIRDSGVGIAREALRRIFEPFFSTKSFEFTLGLGLTFAQNLVQGLGGWITVRSQPGQGTIFRVFLPCAPEEAPPEVQPPEVDELEAGDKVALVVDDSAEIVEAASAALGAAGVRVLVATSAEEALALYGEKAAEISFAVVDALLPDEGGAAVVEAITKQDPRAGIVVTSGFSRDFVRTLLPMGAWLFLQKPYKGDQLVERIRDCLRRRKG